MASEFGATLQVLGGQLLQRDWLSANHIVFAAFEGAAATVVDTGYACHAVMTLALVDKSLAGAPLQRIVNTHLHSDHCGGNRALQARYGDVQTLVPAPSLATVQAWDEARLSYQPTGQICERFRADGAIGSGDLLRLGQAKWRVHAAPGHDPDALMLFEPQTRTLISGDALWEDRLAIIFPELYGEDGFGATRRTLDFIESLAPRLVLPGHGAMFGDVAGALAASRRRLDTFERDPPRHARHAARSLVMFHMMEHQMRERDALEAWLLATPIFSLSAHVSRTPLAPGRRAGELLDGLIDDGWLRAENGQLRLAASA